MLNYFEEKKETLFDYKKTKFFKVQKMAYFSKGLLHAFGQKMSFFSFFRFDQNKTRNNTSEFAMKNKPFLNLKTEFFKVQKIAFFSKWFNLGFRSKNAKFVFIQIDLVIIRLDIMPNDFAEKKETFFDYKKTEFFKVQKIPFFKNKPRNNVF